MRLIFAVSLAVVLLVLSASFVFADSPADMQSWMISAVHCTGLGTPANVQAAFTKYQARYATDHNFRSADWAASYNQVVNEFVRAHGCSSGAFGEDALSYDFKIYLPTYLYDFVDILPVQFKAFVK